MWRLGTKSLKKGGKAPLFAGFKQGLYNADRLKPGQVVVLMEGEFDTLIVQQELGDLIVPVATGGVTLARQIRWVSQLFQVPLVLVAFDNDAAGEKAAHWWLEVLPHNTKRWRPMGVKDPNDMLIKAGMDLRLWLGPALGIEPPPPEEKPKEPPKWRKILGVKKE